ncbi:MAG TPA: ABC transporter permease [Gemmatimonadaceae bacterium]|nr:ABC transporter permease [Gemmatimonadaceae bacterium]
MRTGHLPARLVRLALRAFPRRFRERYGAEMEAEFDQLHARAIARGRASAWAVTLASCRNLVLSGIAERIGPARALQPSPAPAPRPEDSRMNAILADLRFALRVLRRRPGYALVAIATLGMGIGASTAMFTLANRVVFQPLPWPESDRLVRLYDTNVERGFTTSLSSPANFADWREQQESFTALASYNSVTLTHTDVEPAQSLAATAVSAEWTEVLRTPPALGRAFTRDDETFGNHRVVILSHGFWQRQFGGDQGIVGRPISIDGNPYTVVGVMPRGFTFPTARTELWTPLAYDFDVATTRGVHYITVIGRLKPGVTLAAAGAEMDLLMQRLARAHPEPLEGWGVSLVSLHEATVGRVRDRMLVFLGAVALVLLVACINVANLSMAHAVTRSRELAVRAAMGAAGWRLARQLAFEGMAVAAVAGGLGIAVGSLTLRSVVAFAPTSIPRLDAVAIDATALVFATLLSLVIGVAVGVLPAWRASRRDLFRTLREGARAASAAPRANRLRGGFVVAQVALAVILAAGASLLVKSFARLSDVDPGFSAGRALVGTVSVPRTRYPDAEERTRFFLQLVERLERIPGVVSAAATTQLPLEGYSIGFVYWVDGSPSTAERPSGDFRVVTPGYFETMGIRLIRGRTLTDGDGPAAPPVIVIDESLARAAFGDADPIGRRIHLGLGGEQEVAREVVGVVRDVRQRALDVAALPGYYVPITQVPWSTLRVIVRTSVDPVSVRGAFEREVAGLDPLIPLRDVATVENLLSGSVVVPRFNTLLLGTFAALALLLAAAGIYSVMSYAVTQRTHEIGVRMALGAGTGAVRRTVSGSALRLAGIGVGVGIVIAFAVTPLMASLLFEVGARDPLAFVVPPLLFLAVAWLGSWLPARRASRVDPIIALRSE